MAFSFPLTIPSAPGFRKIRWNHKSAIGFQESKFSYVSKTYDWSGQVRIATITLPKMDVANAKAWQTWALKLNGRQGTFYLKDSLNAAPRGIAEDSYSGALVDGASQSGSTLDTDGWLASQSGIFLPGDWISVGDRLYTILTEASSNAGGEILFDVWPNVEGHNDNDPILVGSAARGIFRLVDWPDWGWDEDRLCGGFSFTAREDI